MGIQPFDKVRASDQHVVMDVQETIFQWSSQLKNQDLFPGRLIEGVELSTTAVNVEHGLTRLPLGWIVVDRDADESVFRSSALTTSFLPLTASGSVTVSLWVF